MPATKVFTALLLADMARRSEVAWTPSIHDFARDDSPEEK